MRIHFFNVNNQEISSANVLDVEKLAGEVSYKGHRYHLQVQAKQYGPIGRIGLLFQAIFHSFHDWALSMTHSNLKGGHENFWEGVRTGKMKLYIYKEVSGKNEGQTNITTPTPGKETPITDGNNNIKSQLALESKLLNPIDHFLFKQIMVMDQRDQDDVGEEACGYHVFKNALVALSLSLNNHTDIDAFCSREVYDSFYNFMAPYNQGEQGNRDLSIANLSQIMKDFIAMPSNGVPEAIRPMHQALVKNPCSVSMFNIANDELGVVNPSNLSFLKNLVTLSRAPGPVTHAFLMGAFPHWTTIIMEKMQDNEINWYGCDSYFNPANSDVSTSTLRNHIELLMDTFTNLTPYLKHSYEHSVGADFRSKAGRIELLLNNIENIQPTVNQIIDAFEFMQHAGWLDSNDNDEKMYVRNLKTLADVLPLYLGEEDQAKLAHVVEGLAAIPA